jgi:protein-S-isoprenylcysteine O-methyltransferase Ste14
MPVSPDEARTAAAVMVSAYLAMAGGAFLPAWNARRSVEVKVRGERKVHAAVEALWVSVQAAVFGALLVALAAPDFLRSSPLSLLAQTALPLTGVGTAIFLAGCALAAWAALHLGDELTVAIQTREGGDLVTTGPYARVRHPMYTGILLMVGGEALAFASPVLVAFVVVALACARTRALAEEALLASDPVHGQAYGAYLARTGRFLPFRPKPGAEGEKTSQSA